MSKSPNTLPKKVNNTSTQIKKANNTNTQPKKANNIDIQPKSLDSKTLNYCMVLDIETTGFPEKLGFYRYYNHTDTSRYDSSRVVQISWGVYDEIGNLLKLVDNIIKPDGFTITNSEYHTITNEIANEKGADLKPVLKTLFLDLKKVSTVVGHNLMFCENVILSEAYRHGIHPVIDEFKKKKKCCTGYGTEHLVKLELTEGKYKMPSLDELYNWCFGKHIENAHDSKHDVIHIAECYFWIKKNIKSSKK